MEEVNRKIETEMSRALEQMKSLKPSDPAYKTAAEAIATLQKARMDEEKLLFEDRKNGDELVLREAEQEQHKAELKAELEQKAAELKAEKRRFRVRTIIDAAAIAVPAALYAYFGIKGFKFEETGSFLSHTNKQNLGNIFRFRK